MPAPASIAPVMPLLLNMSGDDRELMIKALTHPDFDARLMPWKSARQFHSFLDSHEVRTRLCTMSSAGAMSLVMQLLELLCSQARERIAVYKEVLPQSADDSPTNFYAFVLKDIDLLLKDLLDSPEVCWQCLCCCIGCGIKVVPKALQAHNMCLESQPVFANDGSRAYTDFASGTWLETVQRLDFLHYCVLHTIVPFETCCYANHKV